jgi:ATP-dependent Zn protease
MFQAVNTASRDLRPRCLQLPLFQDFPNLGKLASKLAGRPMSNAAWVVNEAARLAARGKKDAIDEIDLFSALKRLRI